MKYFYPQQETTPMKTRITAALIFGFVLGAFSAAQATKPETDATHENPPTFSKINHT